MVEAEACAACGPAIIGAIVACFAAGIVIGYALRKAFE